MNVGALRRRSPWIALAAIPLASLGCTDDPSPFSTPSSIVGDSLTVLPDVDGDLAITVTDFEAAAAAMGVSPLPADADAADAQDWIRQLFDARLHLELPDLVGNDLLEEPDVVVDEFGWSPYDIDVASELIAEPESLLPFTVLSGDVEWTSDAVDLGGGVGSLGTGDDEIPDTAEQSRLRPLGEPIRIGARDGLIAAGPSSAQMQQWVDGSMQTASNDPRLTSLAERLDASDVYSATVVRRSFLPVPGDPNPVIDRPFTVLGVGISRAFDDLRQTIVYAFDSRAVAGEAVGSVRDGWNALDVAAIGGSTAVSSVEQLDDTVVVKARITNGGAGEELMNLARDAGLLVHTASPPSD